MATGLLAAPAFQLAAQNPLAALEDAAKEKLAEQAIEKLLNDQLPLTLNANDVYPTVANLPGGPFNPQPLKLTADELNQPLAPGDYTINTLDFCSEYSVHAPGAGVAYVLGPYEGKAAGAIGALIWRGTVQYQINPNSLQAVSWAIQSGLSYTQMPKTYQGIIDRVIPDYKSEINGDFVSNLETTYNSAARTAKLPPLDTILAKLGKPGELALSAERQRAILLAQGTNDQLRDQTLFQGQQSGLYTPVKAENGPWTERVKGQVYMKLLIAGGNMATNNVLQIRIMPPAVQNAQRQFNRPHLVLAGYSQSDEPQWPAELGVKLYHLQTLLEGMLGYSQGQGAQALGQVPVVLVSPPGPGTNEGPDESAPPEPLEPPAPYNPPPTTAAPPPGEPTPPTETAPPPPATAGNPTPPSTPPPTSPAPPSTPVVSPTKPATPCPIGKATEIVGTVTVIRNGAMISLKVGDPICVGDTIQTGANSWVIFLLADNTQWMMAAGSTASVTSYVFDSKKPAGSSATFDFLVGVFQYVSGLIGKDDPGGFHVETPAGDLGFRGTELIGLYNNAANNLEVDLINGSVAVTPNGTAATTMSAPVQIELNSKGLQALPLTQTQYNTIESQNFPGIPIS